MALAEIELLCAAQSAGATREIRDQFAERFLAFLRHYSGRYCCVYKLDFSMIDDLVDMTIMMALDKKWARFDPARGETHLTYLLGLLQNAAKRHARLIHRGGKLRQDWGDPLVAQLHLPTCLEEIIGQEAAPQPETKELAKMALGLADDDERSLIERHFFQYETIESIAKSMGVARTTVSRRLERFYGRAAALIAA